MLNEEASTSQLSPTDLHAITITTTKKSKHASVPEKLNPLTQISVIELAQQ